MLICALYKVYMIVFRTDKMLYGIFGLVVTHEK